MLKDLVKATRTYRKYDQSHVIEESVLRGIVDIARFSNSGSNLQPFRYKIVCTQPMLDKLFALTKWGGRYKDYTGPAAGEQPTGFIVICCDENIRTAKSAEVDTGIVATVLVLAAGEIGLGSCMIGNFPRKECRELLELPEKVEPMLVVAFGKPNDTIVLEELEKGASTDYYRDEKGVHHVPKRKLDDLLLP